MTHTAFMMPRVYIGCGPCGLDVREEARPPGIPGIGRVCEGRSGDGDSSQVGPEYRSCMSMGVIGVMDVAATSNI
jgi:hypothetical protein